MNVFLAFGGALALYIGVKGHQVNEAHIRETPVYPYVVTVMFNTCLCMAGLFGVGLAIVLDLRK